MDMVEVTRISLLKKYPFQCWETEKFAPEQLNYNEIALAGYKYRWRNEKLYYCDYLPDGLTQNMQIVKNNPMGFAMMHNQNMLIQKGFKANFRSAAYMIALVYYAKEWKYLKESNNKVVSTLALPLGIVLGKRRKKQFAQLD